MVSGQSPCTNILEAMDILQLNHEISDCSNVEQEAFDEPEVVCADLVFLVPHSP